MRLRELAIAEIEATPGRSWFVTLTFDPHHLAGCRMEAMDAPPSLHGLRRRTEWAAFRHVQRYFKRLRKAGARFRYLCVFEEGENTGRPHYHLLLHEIEPTKPLLKRSLEYQWRSHVHCRLVASGRGAASYVSKYATKTFDIRPRHSTRYGDGPEPSRKT